MNSQRAIRELKREFEKVKTENRDLREEIDRHKIKISELEKKIKP